MASIAAAAHETVPVSIGQRAPRGGVLGLLPELGADPLGLFTSLARDYGDLVRLRLGLTRTVLISHPRLVEEVLVTDNANFRKNIGVRRLGSVLGNGLLLSEGDFWLRQRRLMQPAFHHRRLAQMGATMVSLAAGVLDTWHDGDTRDTQAEMTEVTLRIAARTLFGTDVAEDVARIRAANLVMTAHFRSRLFSLLILLPDSVPTPGNLRFQRAIRDLDALVYRIIGERRASTADLLGMLLAARDPVPMLLSAR